MKTIRNRLIIIFSLCLVFISASTLIYYQSIFELKKKTIILEQFDDFRENLLELRRYEKNVFLARDLTSLDPMMHYLSESEASFNRLSGQISAIMGSAATEEFQTAFDTYRQIAMSSIDAVHNGCPTGKIIEQIREYGKQLNDFVQRLSQTKRQRIQKMLNQISFIPIAFIATFLIIVVFTLKMTRDDILKPLSLLHQATERAMQGDFEPISHSKDKADEVSQCVSAFNRMANEIESRQEQLLQSRKMASIGTFTSGIAHELNNPINNISLIVESLTDDGDRISTEERNRLYSDLNCQAERAAEIVKSLLEFSRTDQVHLDHISLEVLMEKTLRLVQNEIRLNHIRIKKMMAEDVPSVWIEKSRLQQALLNLIINAIQAMPDGGELGITIEHLSPSHEVRITISDTGKGIHPDQMNIIFDPFFTTKKEGEGTGLGLSVTYSIIEKHGGRIKVDSEPGKGTCFSIFLPSKERHDISRTC